MILSKRLALVLSLAVLTMSAAYAEAPKMEMTTEVPPGIATPDSLETRLGTLTSVDGVPDAATAQKVYDNLDFQRGVQAYLNTIQIASMYGLRKGLLEFGPANTTAVLFETLMDSKALWLTPNTTSVYMASWLELGDEPMVIETPPNVLGIIDNFWFEYVTDFGNAGPDKGKGGKFLILPPGYDGEVPDGYHVARTATYGNWVIWRGFQEDGSPAPAVAMTKKLFRMYPLSQKDNPPEMTFVNISGKFNNTIHGIDADVESQTDVAEEFGTPSTTSVTETRKYVFHRKIERNRTAARQAKKFHGTRCQACGLDFSERYGDLGKGFIEAHHLRPIATLDEGVPVTYDVAADFAVLCSNCHRMIHRFSDPSDLVSFRVFINANVP